MFDYCTRVPLVLYTKMQRCEHDSIVQHWDCGIVAWNRLDSVDGGGGGSRRVEWKQR